MADEQEARRQRIQRMTPDRETAIDWILVLQDDVKELKDEKTLLLEACKLAALRFHTSAAANEGQVSDSQVLAACRAAIAKTAG